MGWPCWRGAQAGGSSWSASDQNSHHGLCVFVFVVLDPPFMQHSCATVCDQLDCPYALQAAHCKNAFQTVSFLWKAICRATIMFLLTSSADTPLFESSLLAHMCCRTSAKPCQSTGAAQLGRRDLACIGPFKSVIVCCTPTYHMLHSKMFF